MISFNLDCVSAFEAISVEEIPISSEGHSLVEIYVFFPHSKAFIKFLSVGDTLDAHKLGALKTHLDPKLYIKTGALLQAEVLKKEPEKLQAVRSEGNARDKIQDLNKKVREELKAILTFLKKDPEEAQAEAAPTLARMEKFADDILATIAPDVDDLRKFLIGNLKYILLMEDAAAIISIAVTAAIAHGFDSRAIYRDLSLACVLMDAPLSELSEETMKQYYKDASKLDAKSAEIIRQHPITSAQSISIRIKSFSPTVVQLILGHHELFNGRGFPKSTRSELLPAVVRSLSLAVDIFYIMKRAHLNQQEIDLSSAVEQLRERDVPPHKRRHNQKLLNALLEFLGPQDIKIAA